MGIEMSININQVPLNSVENFLIQALTEYPTNSEIEVINKAKQVNKMSYKHMLTAYQMSLDHLDTDCNKKDSQAKIINFLTGFGIEGPITNVLDAIYILLLYKKDKNNKRGKYSFWFDRNIRKVILDKLKKDKDIPLEYQKSKKEKLITKDYVKLENQKFVEEVKEEKKEKPKKDIDLKKLKENLNLNMKKK